jgi:hypothetical protein
MFPKCRDYPDHIIVKGQPWDVKFCRNTPEGPDTDVGLYDPENKCIYIKYKQTPRQTFQTAFHEWLHIVEDEYQIEIGHPIIEKLEEAIADFVEQNPDIFISMLFKLSEAD